MESIHKFNDIKISTLKSYISKVIKKDPNDLIFAALGFSCIGEIFNDSVDVSHMLFSRQKGLNRPKIFLCELNDFEKEHLKSDNH